ncbi:hypothetical protein [Nocardioides sp. MH1]|uniref:hypothetical protein n=1 Tax=Nocardioides sp. MH1 TaxID=3242490 RepID=UPI0035208A49
MNHKAVAIGWLPVLGLVAAMFAFAPSSEGAAQRASLDVTPGAGWYGGTPAHWVGTLDYSTGSPQKIHLQRTGKLGSAWADVENSNVGSTDARGHFDFWFPSPAMNAVYFRVVSGKGASPAHHFTSKHQDADVRVYETLTPDGVPALDETIAEGIAVKGEGFTLKVDTVHGAKGENKPPLPGRLMTLQRRTGPGAWTDLLRGTLGKDGAITFDGVADLKQVAGDYRVRMEKYIPANAGQCVGQQPCEIGEFFTFPYHLKVVDRPASPLGVSAKAPAPSTVDLSWRPVPGIDHYVVARTFGGGAPGYRGEIARPLAGDTSYTDDLGPFSGGSTVSYTVFAVSSDGVYSLVGDAHDTVTTPPDPKTGGER